MKHRTSGDFWSYYTPVLQLAYNLGLDGVSIQENQPVKAFRFGAATESYISWNYAENAPEKGLSVYTESSTIRGEFESRKKYEYTCLATVKGGDGELLILAFEAEYLD